MEVKGFCFAPLHFGTRRVEIHLDVVRSREGGTGGWWWKQEGKCGTSMGVEDWNGEVMTWRKEHDEGGLSRAQLTW